VRRQVAGLLIAAGIFGLGACGRPSVESTTPRPETNQFANALDVLECDGRPSEMGGLANDFGPEGAGDTPDAAFASWVSSTIFPVPRSGYNRLFESEGEPCTPMPSMVG
jgi:hypothetical protein